METQQRLWEFAGKGNFAVTALWLLRVVDNSWIMKNVSAYIEASDRYVMF